MYTLFSIYNRVIEIESHKRSMAKALTYRFLGSLITGGITLAVIGRLDVALGVALIDGVVKMGAYFLHERLWAKVKWGMPNSPDYQI